MGEEAIIYMDVIAFINSVLCNTFGAGHVTLKLDSFTRVLYKQNTIFV